MKKKYLFYPMQGQEMCFMHVLLNAMDLHEAGHEVKIVFEGASVKLPPVFEEKKLPLYLKVKEAGLIAGVCEACARTLGSLEAVLESGLPVLNDMQGHAGLKPFIEEGYEVFVF